MPHIKGTQSRAPAPPTTMKETRATRRRHHVVAAAMKVQARPVQSADWLTWALEDGPCGSTLLAGQAVQIRTESLKDAARSMPHIKALGDPQYPRGYGTETGIVVTTAPRRFRRNRNKRPLRFRYAAPGKGRPAGITVGRSLDQRGGRCAFVRRRQGLVHSGATPGDLSRERPAVSDRPPPPPQVE